MSSELGPAGGNPGPAGGDLSTVAPAAPPARPGPGPSYLADDVQMLRVFMASLATASVNTELAYRKELGRFMTWCLAQGYPPGQTLARINRGDIEAYLQFLRSPAPLAKSGPVKNPNNEARAYWKAPRPLADASVAHAATLLRTFFAALTEYEASVGVPVRTTNPVKKNGIKRTRKSERQPGERARPAASSGRIERVLTMDDMTLVFETIEGLRQDHPRHYARARWLMHLAYRSFLRINEIAELQMGDFERDETGWQIYIHSGKGTTESTWIRASSRLIEELILYRRSRRLFPYPLPRDGNPAVLAHGNLPVRQDPHGSVLGHGKVLPRRGREHPVSAPVLIPLLDRYGQPTGAIREEYPPRVERRMSARALFAIVKQVFRMAAARSSDPGQRARLAAASPHWLRHTGITHARNAGASLRSLKAQARHRSELATARYEHGSSPEQANDMEKLG